MLSVVALMGTLDMPRHAYRGHPGRSQSPAGKLAARATTANPSDGVTLTVLPAILPIFTAPAVPPLGVPESDD